MQLSSVLLLNGLLPCGLNQHTGIKMLCLCCDSVSQELRAEINKKILEAERQLENTYVSAKTTAQKKWADARSEL